MTAIGALDLRREEFPRSLAFVNAELVRGNLGDAIDRLASGEPAGCQMRCELGGPIQFNGQYSLAVAFGRHPGSNLAGSYIRGMAKISRFYAGDYHGIARARQTTKYKPRPGSTPAPTPGLTSTFQSPATIPCGT